MKFKVTIVQTILAVVAVNSIHKNSYSGSMVRDFGEKPENNLSSCAKLNPDLGYGDNLTFHWELIVATPEDNIPSWTSYSKIKIGIKKTSVGWAGAGWGTSMHNGNIILMAPNPEEIGLIYVSECKLIGWKFPQCEKLTSPDSNLSKIRRKW